MEQNINEIEINGLKYIRKDSVKETKQYEGDIKIVVLQRGWIYVGRFERNGNDCKLHNASYDLYLTKAIYEIVTKTN